MLSETAEDFEHSLHGEFSKEQRTKLAYELAESALILLGTGWFSELCSCAVRRCCLDDTRDEYEYSVRIKNVRHLEPGSGEAQALKQWCEEELKDMHIRRLGIVLAEIAIGAYIFGAVYNHNKKRVEITSTCTNRRLSRLAFTYHARRLVASSKRLERTSVKLSTTT